MPPHFANMNTKTLAAIRPRLDEAAFAHAWAEGQALSADEAVALAVNALE